MAESAKKTVEALWVAPYEATLPDGTVLIPNETKVRIGAGEAEASDHWEPVGSSAKKTSKESDE